jgi:hypothetical protein
MKTVQLVGAHRSPYHWSLLYRCLQWVLVYVLLQSLVEGSLDLYLDNLYPQENASPPASKRFPSIQSTIQWRPVNCMVANYQLSVLEFVEKTKWTDTYVVQDVVR